MSETEKPIEIEKQIAGMRDKLLEYKKLLRAYRRQERYVYDLHNTSVQGFAHELRVRTKLQRAVWNVVHDSPKSTAEEIKLYLDKVLKGLGL